MTKTRSTAAFTCALLAVAAAACGGAGPGTGTREPAEATGPLSEEPFDLADMAVYEIAIREIDAGNFDRAIDLLSGLGERYPNHRFVVHELALTYRLQGRPDRAVALLRPYEPFLDEQLAAAYGSALDEAGQARAALASLERALERFPRSGLLHSEIGTVLGRAGKLEEALEFWERGMEVQPEWPSNYLRAAEIYSHTNATGLTLIYGEVFRNLEPGSKRSAAVGALMVQTLHESVEIAEAEGGTKITINLAPALTVTVGGASPDGMNPILAGMPLVNAFEIAISEGLSFTLLKQELSLASLYEIKKAFLEFWWQPEGLHAYHDVRLFEWLRQLRDAGHLEAYTYWLYGPAFPDEFFAWRDGHQAALDACLEWLDKNPLYELPYDENYPAGQEVPATPSPRI